MGHSDRDQLLVRRIELERKREAIKDDTAITFVNRARRVLISCLKKSSMRSLFCLVLFALVATTWGLKLRLDHERRIVEHLTKAIAKQGHTGWVRTKLALHYPQEAIQRALVRFEHEYHATFTPAVGDVLHLVELRLRK